MPSIIVTEEQWVKLGSERFAQGGSEALVIEKMASQLKCSKSSFYWYFDNRAVFIRKIVDYWIRISTQQVIEASTRPDTPEAKLTGLLVQMFSVTQKGDFLFYLRKLSQKERAYRQLLDQLELTRMTFAKELFIQNGLPADKAERQSWLLYHYYLGWYERHKDQQLTEEAVHQHIAQLQQLWL